MTPPSDGWNFSGTISAGSTIGSFPATGVVNGQHGFTSASVTIPGGAAPTITVTESPLNSGLHLRGRKLHGRNGTAVSGTVNTTNRSIAFTGAANVPINCVFTNKQSPVAVTFQKAWANGRCGDTAA